MADALTVSPAQKISLPDSAWWLLFIFAVLCAPDASAQYESIGGSNIFTTFSCNLGVAVGQLFNGSITSCDALGVTNAVSSFVCNYELLMSEMLGNIYCKVLGVAEVPFTIALTLFFIFTGLGILTGVLPFTPGSIVATFLKMAIIYAVALDSDTMINLIYRGLLGFMNEAIGAVMASAGGTNVLGTTNYNITGVGQMLQYFDDVVRIFTSTSATTLREAKDTCSNGILPVLGTLLAGFPTLGILLGGALVGMAMALLRALIGYLLAITAIMLLISMAPLFLALGLFKFTMPFMIKWIKYLLSFALQVVIVFALIAMLSSLEINSQVQGFTSLIMPFNGVTWLDSVSIPALNVCTVCEHTLNTSGVLECTTPRTPADITELVTNPTFLETTAVIILKIFLLSKLVEKALEMGPELAKSLSMGEAHVTSFVGGSSSVNLPGFSAFGAGGRGFLKEYRSGGNIVSRTGRGAAGFWNATMTGDKANGGRGLLSEILGGMTTGR